ncbi:hypothetical protein Trydic_g23878 [Trypoxylus dichotomus]
MSIMKRMNVWFRKRRVPIRKWKKPRYHVVKKSIAKTKTKKLTCKMPKLIKHLPIWEKILQLPLDPTWNAVINLQCVAIACYYGYNASGENCILKNGTLQSVLDLADIFYTMDVVLTLISMIVSSLGFQKKHLPKRPILMLVFEIFSLFPLEWTLSYKEHKDRIKYCTLKINRSLRIVKIYHFFRRYFKALDDTVYVRVAQIYTNIILLLLFSHTFYCNAYLWATEYKDRCTFITIWKLFTKITASGIVLHSFDNLMWGLTLLITMFLSFFIILFARSHLIVIGVENILDKYRFDVLFKTEIVRLRNYNLPQHIMLTLQRSFALTWEKCGGFNEDKNFFRYLPQVMGNEVLLGVSWSAFSHSNLFRDASLTHLRHLSGMVKQCYYMPGEFVFRKNEIKDKMVYVMSGTIHLLSADDSESHILSLCGGTSIGESSLLISYMSKVHVYCDKFCELYIVERKDFIKLSSSYPELYNHYKETIWKRYANARRLKMLKDHARSLMEKTKKVRDPYTMEWIKNTLHRLMSTDEESTARHELQNIYLEHDMDTSIFQKMAFCANYLDQLTIKERLETVDDTVFVKTTFPWILQPNSIVIRINECFLTIATVAVSCLLPYMCFVAENVPQRFFNIVNAVTFYNWLDLYIQISTGIYTRNETVSKILSIIAAKLGRFGFWCDMISCIPLEIFSSVILEVVNDRNLAALLSNRLLKLYRVFQLFQTWERGLRLNIVVIRYMKFFCMYTYIIYFLSCVLIRFYPKMEIVDVVFCAVQLVTGVGLMGRTFFDRAILFFTLDLLFFLIRLVMYCQIISAYVIAKVHDIFMKEMCRDVLDKLKKYKIGEKYGQRTVRFLSTQNLHKIIIERYNDFFYVAKVRKSIDRDIKEFVLTDVVASHVFFQSFSGECLRDICAILQPVTLPKNEVIIYAGDISDVVYIVRVGAFTTYDADGEHVPLARGDRVINLLPAIFGTSAALSYVTVTDCRIVYFDIGKFRHVLTKHPKYLTMFEALVADCDDISRRLKRYAEIEAATDITSALNVREKSYYFFGFDHQIDSFEESDYMLPFDHLGLLSFVHLCLMRFTFLPNGRFIHVWEIFRCVFAISNALLVFTPPAYMASGAYIILALDVTAIIDIYIRMHVCYYNEIGVLVKHPLQTTAHYLSHGFLIDLIAAFPFKYLALTDYTQAVAFFLSRGNCLLQLHRYIQYLSALRTNSVSLPNIVYCAAYLPILLVAANVFGCVLTKLECNFESNLVSADFIGGLYCANDSVFANSPFLKPISPWRAHIYSTYIFVSVLTTCGWQGYTLASDTSRIIVLVLSFVGLYCTVHLFAYMVSFYANHYRPMLQYQELMRHLKRFMQRVGVAKKLREYVIESCEKYWAHCQGQPISEAIQFLYPTLQLDILYDCYGEKAFLYSIFENRNKNFYRNMLRYGWTDVVMKNEYVMTVNQLTKTLKIVLDGIVDVIGPDGVQITTLYPGSIFGNLENRTRIRAKNTLIAATHTEIFLIPAKKFYQLVASYPKMEEDFFMLKSMNVSYISNQIRYLYVEKSAAYKKNVSTSLFNHIFNPNSRGMHVWNIIILVVPCFLGIMVDFYQLGAGDFSYYVLIMQYISDVLYGIDYLLLNRVAYEDHKGTMVMDMRKIRERNRKHRFMHTLSLISLVPLDVFVLAYHFASNVKSIIYAFFRLNRLIRIINVFGLFNRLSQKLNANVEGITVLYVTLWVTLYLTGTGALIGVVSCSVELNMEPKIEKCIDLHAIGYWNRTDLYIRLMYYTLNSLTLNTQRTAYPQGSVNIALFVVVMLLGHVAQGICLARLFEMIFGKRLPKYLYRCVLKRFKFFTSSEDLSASLRQRAESTMASVWESHEGMFEPLLLNKRPTYLKDALFNDAFSRMMRAHPLFKNCHKDCLRQIIDRFAFRPFYNRDYVQLENIRDGRMFVLIYGKIAVLTNVDTNINDFVDVLEGEAHFFGILAGIYPKMAHSSCNFRLPLPLPYSSYLQDFSINNTRLSQRKQPSPPTQQVETGKRQRPTGWHNCFPVELLPPPAKGAGCRRTYPSIYSSYKCSEQMLPTSLSARRGETDGGTDLLPISLNKQFPPGVFIGSERATHFAISYAVN